ncbi:MAG: hypothetical protein MK188_12995 [Gammaproteobacteria bacterium]|nr:hypothetical protein [Gammaproteobacteria bacterium]
MFAKNNKAYFIAIPIFVVLILLAVFQFTQTPDETDTTNTESHLKITASESTSKELLSKAMSNRRAQPESLTTSESKSEPEQNIIDDQSTLSDQRIEVAETCNEDLKQQLASLLEKIDSTGPYEPTSISEGEAQLNASYEYLSLLDEQSLSDLADQGYRDAMTVQGERLLNSDIVEHLIKGRELLYEAGVLGSAYALSGLSGSYYSEYLTLLDAGAEDQARLAYQRFHNTKHLMEKIALIPSEPDAEFESILKNDELMPSDQLETSNKESIDEFNQHRVNEGLPMIGEDNEQIHTARLLSSQLRECIE